MMMKPWAAKGVALYPPGFCMVGQNQIFNALHQFRRSFWDGHSRDIAGFFVAFGDWGLGKTRLGYELVGEATGGIDEWLLNEHEYIVAPYNRKDTKARILEPALSDGILPMYIRYSSICDDDLDAPSWVARLTIEALRQTLDCDVKSGGVKELYSDITSTLHAKGVSLEKLANCVKAKDREYSEQLDAVMDALKPTGINHLWVIVDEVETPGDLKHGLRDDALSTIDDEFLLMVSEVIKHENWRSQHPYVNFLLLCSMGMRDQIQIGPNLRRASSVTIEPNQVTDVQRYMDHIKLSLNEPESVDYPAGTLEAAFLSANRNFGWLNVIMSSVHETFARHRERSEQINSWELIRDFAKTDARAGNIFNDNAAMPLIGRVKDVPAEIVERIVYGQLPVGVGGTSSENISPAMADALLEHEIAGRGKTFAGLFMVHIDANTLADELTRPEYGFKPREGKTDSYFTSTCELSVVGLLKALRAFSVTAGSDDTSDIVIYTDLEQWGEQLAALYPREGIEFAAEALHRIFLSPDYRIKDTRFVGMSFRLWKEFNKLLNANTESVRFFKEGRFEESLDEYITSISSSKTKCPTAICLGLAKMLDESLSEARTVQALSGISHQVLTSRFISPAVEGFRVTPDGKLTIVYCTEIDETIRKLSSYLGGERVHPIIVLFPASADYVAFEEQLERYPLLKRCVLISRLVVQEEDFLMKYSARDSIFDPQEARLSKVANGLLKSYQDDWIAKARSWSTKIRQKGYLIAPLWSRSKGIQVGDFTKGYRYMLAQNCSLDATHQDHGGPLNGVEFENCKQAAKKNATPPTAWNYGDLLEVLTTDGSNQPRTPRCFFAIIRELKTQTSAKKLANNFFFIVPETEFKAVRQIEQILELLIGLGVIRQSGGELFRAVDQNQLESRRQAASKWLKNECKSLVKGFEDLFPTQASILLKASYSEAVLKLEAAEKKIQTIDFSIHSAPSVSALTEDMFAEMVGQILDVETLITGICPLEIGNRGSTEFECYTSQIGSFEHRYSSLSLWQKVSFLSWLKKQFLAKREEILSEIDDIFNNCDDLKLVNNQPFPVAPLTLPLKAIKSELENALKGFGSPTMTRRATIKAGSYPLLVDQYLVDSKYESAWERLSALEQLVTPDLPESFHAKFTTLRKKWEFVISTFSIAGKSWDQLSEFVKDAPKDAVTDINAIKFEITKYNEMIIGGLEKQIQSQCEDLPEDELMELLKTEVEACEIKLQPLNDQIIACLESIKVSLRKILRTPELQALNKLLQAQGKSIMSEPQEADTYLNTKTAYESFNTEVLRSGERIFNDDDIEAFANVFYDHQEPMEKLQPVLDRVVAVWKDRSEQEREDVRSLLQKYIRAYGFLSQLMTFEDVDLEKLYAFARHLNRKLPKRLNRLPYDVLDAVDLESFRIQETFTGALTLMKDDAEIRSRLNGGFAQLDEEKDLLSNIVNLLNETYGVNLTEEDTVDIERIKMKLDNDEELQAVMTGNNTLENMRYKFDQTIEALILDFVYTKIELYKKLSEPQAKQLFKQKWFEEYYHKYRTQAGKTPLPESLM